MSGYGSKRAVREVVIATLEKEGRNPDAYNIAGIMRDAFHDRGREYGYGALEEAAWRAAVEKHRRPFGVGDMVRVAVDVDGLTEHHYGRIASFRKANGGFYRARPVKPHSAHIELIEHSPGFWPLSEVTLANDDFEIIADYAEVHRGAGEYMDGYYKCRECARYTYKAADVKVIHKSTGECVRLCTDCNTDERRARLGHSVMWDQRLCKDTILRLTAHPEDIAGPADDYEAQSTREWADAYPYLVPAEAAKRYTHWKEQQNATVAA